MNDEAKNVRKEGCDLMYMELIYGGRRLEEARDSLWPVTIKKGYGSTALSFLREDIMKLMAYTFGCYVGNCNNQGVCGVDYGAYEAKKNCTTMERSSNEATLHSPPKVGGTSHVQFEHEEDEKEDIMLEVQQERDGGALLNQFLRSIARNFKAFAICYSTWKKIPKDPMMMHSGCSVWHDDSEPSLDVTLHEKEEDEAKNSMLDDVGGNKDGGMVQQRWRRIKCDLVAMIV
ncbi:hypothetical protein V8G54_021629 [Vigna mungo]|uniref:Uncharacterized protein n=1 Tax=Vigna mungo TaxID=3915 RepID=A0AAQ3RX16_VIGMU